MSQQPLARNENPSNSPAKQHSILARFTAVLGTFFSLIAVFWIAAPSPVSAGATATSFTDAIAASETIAIVRLVELPACADVDRRLRPARATLDFLQILKGNPQLGKQEVRFKDYPSGAPGEFIAFLDKNRVWRFTARPSPGKKIESDVLGMEGFDDSDLHGVFPGLITLEQLKTYLKDGTLRYSIEGPIWFPQRLNPAWKASGIRIRLSYDAVKKEARVIGLPKLAGFPAETAVRIEYRRDARQVEIIYSRFGCRPLRFLGQVEGMDLKSASMLARFVVTAPDVLDADTFQKYLADSRLGHCYYKFRLHCAASKQYLTLTDLMLTLRQEIGRTGTLEGWGGESLQIIRTAYSGPSDSRSSATRDVPEAVGNVFASDWVLRMVIDTDTNQYLMLAFDLGKPKMGEDVFHWTFQNELLYDVYSAPTRGTLQLYDGKTWHRVTTFTVDLDPVQFGSAR
jgi:hypothetical protein